MTIEKQKRIRYIPFYRITILFETLRYIFTRSIGAKRVAFLFLKIWISALITFLPISLLVLSNSFVQNIPILHSFLLIATEYLMIFIVVTICIKEQEKQ